MTTGRLAMLVVGIAGCHFSHGELSRDAGGDAPVDVAPFGSDATDAGDAATPCYGTTVIDHVCLASTPTGAMTFQSGMTIDTDTSALCETSTANAIPVCVVAFTSITIPTNVTINAHGGRPLVLIATGGMTIEGVLDVGSHRGDRPGPAALSGSDCLVGATAATGHGGGAGGSFSTAGGNGGNDNTVSGKGIAGAALAAPTTLHGGCPGGVGGAAGIDGSPGGGTVAVIAGSVTLNGVITASGAGGAGAAAGVGGNGGSAGGLIVLDASTITGNGAVLAKGGGGGEGSAGLTANPGFDGFDAAHRAMEGQGGAGGSTGGDGGHGGTAMAPVAGVAGPPGGVNEGGGGGGGASGVNLVLGATPGAMLMFVPQP